MLNPLPHSQSLESSAILANALGHQAPLAPSDFLDP